MVHPVQLVKNASVQLPTSPGPRLEFPASPSLIWKTPTHSHITKRLNADNPNSDNTKHRTHRNFIYLSLLSIPSFLSGYRADRY